MWTNIVNFDKRGNKIPLVKFPKPSLRFAPNFNGVSQSGLFSANLSPGDKVCVSFINHGALVLGSCFIGRESGFRLAWVSDFDNVIVLSSTASGGTIDGQPIVSGLTPPPDDGEKHEICVTMASSSVIDSFGSASGLSNFSNLIMFDGYVNNGSVYSFPMDDGWDNNPTMRNTGSGADGTFINMTEAAWVEIQP